MVKGQNTPDIPPFTEEEIRAKAREIWELRNKKPGAPEDDWSQAIKELELDRSISKRLKYKTLQKSQQFLNWTGFKEKKLWDILQLLFVPVVLAAVGIGFQEFAKNREYLQQKADKEKELEVANDKERQKILSDYLDQMAILLQEKLLGVSVESETFSIAQSRTVTALQALDPKRQQAVIQFLEAASLNLLDGKKGLLYEARMSKVDLRKGDFSGSMLKSSDFSLAKLSGIDLSGSTMRGSDLSGSDLTNAKLGGIDLSHTQLLGTGLTRSDLRIANLTNADLTSADLTGADLTGADLTGADLRDADLTGTNLTRSNLTEAKKLTGDQLNAAKLCGTKLPDNSMYLSDRDCQELSELKASK